MNPIYRNSSNEELARFCEQWAGDAEVKKRKSVSLSPELVRLIAERLRLPTDADIETELAENEERISADAKKRLSRVTSRISAIVEDLESTARILETELNHITDPLEDEEDDD